MKEADDFIKALEQKIEGPGRLLSDYEDPEVKEMFGKMHVWLIEHGTCDLFDFRVTSEGIELDFPRLNKGALICHDRQSDNFFIEETGATLSIVMFQSRASYLFANPPSFRWFVGHVPTVFEANKKAFFRTLKRFVEEIL